MAALGSVCVALVACESQQPATHVTARPPDHAPRAQAAPGALQPVDATHPAWSEPTVRTIGHSVEGRAIDAHWFGDGADAVLIIASIHGSEPAGTPLVEQLMQRLQRDPMLLTGKRVVIVPVANPDGYATGKRFNVRGVDLNRNFPANNRRNRSRFGHEGLSEPESRALATLIDEVRPARIVSIHQPLRCIDYDGPAATLANAMAAVCDLPVKKLGARPGSMGSYTGVDLNIPTITLELPKNATNQTPATLWDLYGESLLVAIRGI